MVQLGWLINHTQGRIQPALQPSSPPALQQQFAVNHMISGNNVPLPSTQTLQIKWFIYKEEWVHPEGIFHYVGSTHRRAKNMSKIMSLVDIRSDRAGTVLKNHFKNGCFKCCSEDLKHVRASPPPPKKTVFW